jgi:beta-fructofuranosidase
MLIGARVQGKGGLEYYTSTNLLDWTRRLNFLAAGYTYAELDTGSDIWEMPVFEAMDNGKHVLVVNPIGGQVSKYSTTNPTRGIYWTGVWQNGRFTPDYIEPKNLDLIEGHLSPTVTRGDDGAPVGIGIVDERRSSQAQLDAGWAHTFSFPRRWRLLEDGETLGQEPIAALTALRDPSSHIQLADIAVMANYDTLIRGRTKELLIQVNAESAADRYGVVIAASEDGLERTRIYYDAPAQQLVLDKSISSQSNSVEDKRFFRGNYDEAAFGKPETFHVFIDHSVVDVFINNSAAFSFRIYPTRTDSDKIFLLSLGGETQFTHVEAWSLRNP